jgi:hypothetical protein
MEDSKILGFYRVGQERMSTFRIQKNRENPYVMLDKFSVKDSGLSWKAKGLLAYLLSKPDDWVINEHDLVEHAKDGRDSMRAGLKELIEAGYVVRSGRRRDSRGRMYENEYHVFERPLVDHLLERRLDYPTPGNPSQVKAVGSYTESRELAQFKRDLCVVKTKKRISK